MKINFALHQHDTERTHEKQRGIVGIDGCFAFIVAHQYGVTDRERSAVGKYPAAAPSDLPYYRKLTLHEIKVLEINLT